MLITYKPHSLGLNYPSTRLPFSPSSTRQALVSLIQSKILNFSSASGKWNIHSLNSHSTSHHLVKLLPPQLIKMSSNELISEILALSIGLESFSNFQILNLDQANGLFAFAPQPVQFTSSCGSELPTLPAFGKLHIRSANRD